MRYDPGLLAWGASVKRLPIALLLLLATASGDAHAQSDKAASPPASESAQVPAAPAAVEEEDPEIVVEGEVPKERRRVCETRAPTGSIMPRRVCRTVEQAELEREASLEAMERIQREREARTLTQEINGVGAP